MRRLGTWTLVHLMLAALWAGCDTETPTQEDSGTGNTASEGEDKVGNGATEGIGSEGVIASWPFEPIGLSPFISLAPSSVAAHTSASAFTSHDGNPTRTISPGINWITESGWGAGAFLACTLQAEEGFSLQLDTLAFQQATFGEEGPRFWRVRSSLDGFASELGSGTVPAFPNLRTESVALGGLVIGTTPVEFRWIADSAPAGQQVSWGLDNVLFAGAVLTTP